MPAQVQMISKLQLFLTTQRFFNNYFNGSEQACLFTTRQARKEVLAFPKKNISFNHWQMVSCSEKACLFTTFCYYLLRKNH
jgi:hypothetical protein